MFSITIGFVGLMVTNAASPVFRKSGFSSLGCPVAGSSFTSKDKNVHATCAVCAWNTGVYPTVITPGCCNTTTCALNSFATLGGFLVVPATSPLLISFLPTPLTLNPTLSPGTASSSVSWCISIDFTSPVTPAGSNAIFSAVCNTPVSTLPTGTVPTPVMEYTSCTGNLKGKFTGLSGSSNASNSWIKVLPLYHGVFELFSVMLSPSNAETGMNGTSEGLNPTVEISFPNSSLSSLNFASS